MKNVKQASPDLRASGRYLLHSAVDEALGNAIIRCADILHDESWQPGARSACVFTSVVLSASLCWLGFDARPMPVAVEGECGSLRFGVGHPAYRLLRPGAWKGHLACMVGDVLVDPTIGQVERWGFDAPRLIAMRCAMPWTPEARVSLPGGTLTWTAKGANGAWQQLPDASPWVWKPAAARLIRRLGGSGPHLEAVA